MICYLYYNTVIMYINNMIYSVTNFKNCSEGGGGAEHLDPQESASGFIVLIN